MSGISILMYHQVGRFPTMQTHRASYCDVDRFAAQMGALARLRIPVLSMTEAGRALSGAAPMPRRAVVLTFDDGARNFREHALPVLRRHGFPAIVYAIAGMVGGRADWLAESGHPAAPLMGWDDLADIRASGIEIGSHALTHRRLADLSADQQAHELAESRRLLQDRLGAPVDHLCYPYGSHDAATLRAAATAGYATGVTCQRGAATPGFDLLALPRKAISQGDNTAGFLWKLFMKDRPKGEALRRPGRA